MLVGSFAGRTARHALKRYVNYLQHWFDSYIFIKLIHKVIHRKSIQRVSLLPGKSALSGVFETKEHGADIDRRYSRDSWARFKPIFYF